MDRVDQFLARKSRNPRLVGSPASAHLGDDHQSVRIRVERLLDNLIGHMRTIVVARIDVVHPSLDGLSQDSNRAFKIARRSPHFWTRQLHSAITPALVNPPTVFKPDASATTRLL